MEQKTNFIKQAEIFSSLQENFSLGIAMNLDYILQVQSILANFGSQDHLIQILDKELQDLAGFLYYLHNTEDCHPYSLTLESYQSWKFFNSQDQVYKEHREIKFKESLDAATQTLKEDK